MSFLLRKLTLGNARNVIIRYNDTQALLISQRNLSIVPSVYDGEKDPAPKFFSSNVQVLLKRLTRPDFSKVFRKRTSAEVPVLRTPKYKFLTDEELEAELQEAHMKADRLLQMPPVVKVHQPVNEVISRDPALQGYDTCTHLFTDITFGVDNAHRIIIQRDPDGTLHCCDHDIRKRLNQVYFPLHGRKLREPMMFTDEEKLHSLLDRQKYEFVLDRACIQYEPDEPSYQRITSVTYQHVDMNKNYDLLRSTRHFGSLVFYLSWHGNVDGLMMELLQSGQAREAVLTSAVRQQVLGPTDDGACQLVHEILSTPIQLSKPESLTEEDIDLDSKCISVLEKYISGTSAMKSQHELALQGFREYYQDLVELSRGLRKAHGNA